MLPFTLASSEYLVPVDGRAMLVWLIQRTAWGFRVAWVLAKC